MEIEKTLVLSTAHVSKEEFSNLCDDVNKNYRHIKHEYGCILVLSKESSGKQFNSPELNKIINFALAMNIKYLDFDQDGVVYTKFKEFDWQV